MPTTLSRLALLFLPAVLVSGAAGALGLGEIDIRSHLGEPLRARIQLLDAPKDLRQECFSVQNGSESGLPGVNATRLALQTERGKSILLVNTAQAVNDPVLQLSLSASCADALKRDYMILLDPPAAFAPTAFASADGADRTPPATPDASEGRQKPRTSQRRPARQPRTRPSEARSFKTQTATTPMRRPAAPASGMRLVLSGGRYRPDPGLDAALALRLDMSLPDMTRRPPAGLNPVELSDENTSLNHKLAYLEKQLVDLQKRNRALESAQQPAPAPPQAPPAAAHGKDASWSRYLVGFGLLAGGVALSFGLRRRSRRHCAGAAALHEPWMPSDASATVIAEPGAMPTKQRKINIASSPHPASDGAAVFTQSPTSAGTEIKEDILDQAEVYVAHGHSNLAVHLLQEHLRQAPTESPVPWLLLLDLLKRDGLDAEYREACVACQSHFNVNLSAPPAVAHTPEGCCLEAYPHLTTHLLKVWGSREAYDFLTDLVYDHRGGTRQGFDPGAYREIVMLRSIAHDDSDST